MSAAEILNSYRHEVVSHQCSTQFISVNRTQVSLLIQLMRIYKDPRLDLTKPLNVDFACEHGADVGGPTKEYFHVAISVLSKVDTLYNIQLFGGQEGHLLPLNGVDAISSGCFEIAGKLIAHSVLHGGPGMAGLSPVVIKYLVTGSIDEAKELVSIYDLYDPELQEILEKKVRNQLSIKQLQVSHVGKSLIGCILYLYYLTLCLETKIGLQDCLSFPRCGCNDLLPCFANSLFFLLNAHGNHLTFG